jgi:hypothetical protein
MDFKQRDAAEEIIRCHHRDLYSGGWAFPAAPFNWTLYLFYGGDIREEELPWLRHQVIELTAVPAVDDDAIALGEGGDEVAVAGFISAPSRQAESAAAATKSPRARGRQPRPEWLSDVVGEPYQRHPSRPRLPQDARYVGNDNIGGAGFLQDAILAEAGRRWPAGRRRPRLATRPF